MKELASRNNKNGWADAKGEHYVSSTFQKTSEPH